MRTSFQISTNKYSGMRLSSKQSFMRNYGTLLFPLLFINFKGICCTSCNPKIRQAIFDSTFYPNLFVMLSTFVILTILIVVLTMLASRRELARMVHMPPEHRLSSVPMASAAMVLGIGLGGFADGIIMHQILQWHEMLSTKLPPTTLTAKSVNMFWDGIFHLFCLVVVTIGVYQLWKVMSRKDVDHSGRILIGGMLLGWGIFNIVEGIIDHHILQLHNVRESSPYTLVYNYGFLLASVVMTIWGYALIRRKNK